MTELDPEERAHLYAYERNRAIEDRLGDGIDGIVWKTNKNTAVKAFDRQASYQAERDCYRILFRRNITEICGFAVPRLKDFSDELLIVEMDIVRPPYILDFGKVYLNHPPAYFTAEMKAEMWQSHQELWGSYWPTIRRILYRLESLGIYYLDPRPKNILPANWDPTVD